MRTKLRVGEIDEEGRWVVTGREADDLAPGTAIAPHRHLDGTRVSAELRGVLRTRWGFVNYLGVGHQLDDDLVYRVVYPAPFEIGFGAGVAS